MKYNITKNIPNNTNCDINSCVALRLGTKVGNKFGKTYKTYCENRSDMILYNQLELKLMVGLMIVYIISQ